MRYLVYSFLYLSLFLSFISGGASGCNSESSQTNETSSQGLSEQEIAEYAAAMVLSIASITADGLQEPLAFDQGGLSGLASQKSQKLAVSSLCHEGSHYSDSCLSLTFDCVPNGLIYEIHGQVTFLGCVVETDLGFMALTGEAEFAGMIEIPPTCGPLPSATTCHNIPISLIFSTGGLEADFGEGLSLQLLSMNVTVSGTWNRSGPEMWNFSITDFSLIVPGIEGAVHCSGIGGEVMGGAGIQCEFPEPPPEPETPPEEPPPPPPPDPCLEIPTCENSDVCQAYLGNCPDAAELFSTYGYDLICQLDPETGASRCRPYKNPETPLISSECSRTSYAWGEFCPITSSLTVDGDGFDCTADADCQTRLFAQTYGSECGHPCFCCRFFDQESGCTERTQEEYCTDCDLCLVEKLRCAGGCCIDDNDQDGFADSPATADPFDSQLYPYEDNCGGLSNPDQADADLDCLGDPCDNCPNIANGYALDYTQGGSQIDIDFDGVGDLCDNCPIVPNNEQNDSDGDGLGDACQGDYDGDHVPDELDNCPRMMGFPPSPDQTDTDGDGLGDICDNCPRTPNPDQTDVTDEFGNPFPNLRGDACDVDVDEDGVPNLSDNCFYDYNPDQADRDEDNWGDLCDNCPDDYEPNLDPYACISEPDNDGIPNAEDNCPYNDNPDQTDSNPDGIDLGDTCSFCLKSESSFADDVDSDGVVELGGCDNCRTSANPDQNDTDGDLIGDACDNCPFLRNFGQKDLDQNGIGDDCQ